MKNKNILLSGVSLFLCFCLLAVSGKISENLQGMVQIIALFVLQIVAFFIPTIFLTRYAGAIVVKRDVLKKKKHVLRLGFVFFSSVAMAIFGMLMNFLLFNINAMSTTSTSLPSIDALESIWAKIAVILAFLIIPAFFEEVFFRGILFRVHTKNLGSGAAIFMSGLCFALIHGNLENFVAPFFAGMLYAYMTAIFGSIVPAVLGHMINNIYSLVIFSLTETYKAFGIWDFFPHLSLIFMFLFIYIAFLMLEKLVRSESVETLTFKKITLKNIFLTIVSPGFLAFVIAFSLKAIFNLF